MNINTKQEINPPCPYTLPKTKLHEREFIEFCQIKLGLSPSKIRADIESWLNEDHGSGDPSLFSAFQKNPSVQFFIVAKQTFSISCRPILAEVFRIVCGHDINLFSEFNDGDTIEKGSILLAGIGNAAGILLAERVSLNLCSKMSGITTKTKNILIEIQKLSTTVQLLETRKTTPGLRIYEKYAVRAAGTRNHRHGLDSGIMLKENHLRSLKSMENALSQLHKNAPILTKIEVEVTNLTEFRSALKLGADVIMLDNFSLSDVKIAVQEKNTTHSHVKLELSGNLDEKNLTEIAKCGVDYMSMGALIHKAVWVDMSLQLYNIK